MRFAYLGALLLSLGGLALLDRRFRLAFWFDARRAALTVGHRRGRRSCCGTSPGSCSASSRAVTPRT